jgi:prepilin-type N-terminal cleavage/methylation domain-containing protein
MAHLIAKLRLYKMSKKAFTLIELLVVVAIISLLVAMLLPALQSARQQAMVVRACVELKQIANALEGYGEENHQRFPPTRTYCASDKKEHWCELPIELVNAGWLPVGNGDSKLSAQIEDVFQIGHTYKYLSPGWGFHNGAMTPKSVWVPDDFPRDNPTATSQTQAGKSYDDVSRPMGEAGNLIRSPVCWIIYSVGPGYKAGDDISDPIAKRSWYQGIGSKGVIPQIRLSDGMQIGLN